MIALVKEREAEGYAYEAAEASFELLARRTLGTVPQFFKVESFRASVERRFNALGEIVTVSEAIVKLLIDGETFLSVAEGMGPVNALDKALRTDLGKYQAEIEDLELADYKVRILNGGTEAITRVLIESTDGTGERWWTVGVSVNIIDASFQALIDSLNYKLIKSGGQGVTPTDHGYDRSSTVGFFCALSAYSLWGIMPFYFKATEHIPAIEMVVHRTIWSVPVALLVIAVQRRLGELTALFRDFRIVCMMVITALLIAVNWGIYVWAISVNIASETALGYYINPLITVMLGYVFLKERLTRLQAIAVAIAFAAVLLRTVAGGVFPWVSLSLAISFAVYGYLRKTVPVGPTQGFLMEVVILTPPALAYVAWLSWTGENHFSLEDGQAWLLMLAGPVTATPLIFLRLWSQAVAAGNARFDAIHRPLIDLSDLIYGFW